MSFTRRQPEILLHFDQILLTSYGITPANITTGLSELNTEFSSGTSFKVGEESYDIIIREQTAEEEEADQRRAAHHRGSRSRANYQQQRGLRLNDIATINKGFGRSRITRVNQINRSKCNTLLRSITGSKHCWMDIEPIWIN